jgi:hypothetical protein
MMAKDQRCQLDDIGLVTKPLQPDLSAVQGQTGETLIRTEDFVPFVLDCFACAVSNAIMDEAASITRTKRGA